MGRERHIYAYTYLFLLFQGRSGRRTIWAGCQSSSWKQGQRPRLIRDQPSHILTTSKDPWGNLLQAVSPPPLGGFFCCFVVFFLIYIELQFPPCLMTPGTASSFPQRMGKSVGKEGREDGGWWPSGWLFGRPELTLAVACGEAPFSSSSRATFWLS